ncbi:MAG: hypothetical protein J0L77_01805 [Alphaproteobacteria bacterium]|nr:hypothetical protein [Alphaproteobacteria bacterium]
MRAFLKKTLSEQRLTTYEALAQKPHETRTAEKLYGLNLLYSKELYVILAGLEIVVRNTFHTAIQNYYQTPNWMSMSLLQHKHQRQVDDANSRLILLKRNNYAIDDLIAQLNFGFWVHLCDRPYEKTIWKNALFKCFSHLGKKPDRKEIESDLKVCHKLRNKIAHLEPIIKYESTLIQDYRTALNLMYAISPEAQEWFKLLSNFERVWENRYEGKSE